MWPHFGKRVLRLVGRTTGLMEWCDIVNTRGVIKVVGSVSNPGAAPFGFPPVVGALSPAAGLHVWMTHIQGTKVTLSAGNAVVPVVAGPFFVTETLGADSNLSAGEELLLQNLCYYDSLLSGKPCTCQPEDFDF